MREQIEQAMSLYDYNLKDEEVREAVKTDGLTYRSSSLDSKAIAAADKAFNAYSDVVSKEYTIILFWRQNSSLGEGDHPKQTIKQYKTKPSK